MRPALSVLSVLLLAGATLAGTESVIHLAPRTGGSSSTAESEAQDARRGFDYSAFESRLESLWFQRKALLVNGRADDAKAQLEQIRSFCAEEGIRRLEHVAGALIAEAKRFHTEGDEAQALSALEFAAVFDPDRPQIHMARAAVLWSSAGGRVAAAGEVLWALRASLLRSARDLSLLPRWVFTLGLAWIGASLVFALLMLLRYQAPLRHDVDEWVGHSGSPPWADLLGWAVLALPLLTWVGAGWVVPYWLVLTFRYMRRNERWIGAMLLGGWIVALPGYEVAVALYGTSADPAVRTTLASVEGRYHPDHVVRLRQLVEAHPKDPTYRFLLAGLYKNGRYFEEAYEEYKAVLEIDPQFVPAHINIGNIFYATGQHNAAITSYRNALAIAPRSFLAHFNLHLAQSEGLHFREADESLAHAREIDAGRVAQLLARSNSTEKHSAAEDATLEMISSWQAAIGGKTPIERAVRQAGIAVAANRPSWANGLAIAGILALVACGLAAAFAGGNAARSCIRCGRPFCARCKRGGQAQEYCSQCNHLFVLRDGLAPETKAKKMFEVERHERRARRLRVLASLVIPGAAQVLRGHAARGVTLAFCWCALLVTAGCSFLEWRGLRLSTDLLLSPEVPLGFDSHPARFLVVLGLTAVWVAGNDRLWAGREG